METKDKTERGEEKKKSTVYDGKVPGSSELVPDERKKIVFGTGKKKKEI